MGVWREYCSERTGQEWLAGQGGMNTEVKDPGTGPSPVQHRVSPEPTAKDYLHSLDIHRAQTTHQAVHTACCLRTAQNIWRED